MKSPLPIKRKSMLTASAAFITLPHLARAQSITQLEVVGPANEGFKAANYAAHSGLFRKYGLDVKVTFLNSGSAAAAALIGGSADVAFTNIVTLIAASAKGVPMEIIAPGPLSADKVVSGLVVLKDGQIKAARDLNGKTIAAPSLGDLLSASVQAWIDRNGGDSRTVKLIELAPSTNLQALEAGQISAAAMNEPFLSQAIGGGKASLLANPYTAIAKVFIAALYAVVGPQAEKKADAMRRFAEAMHEASSYTNAHPAETIDLVAAYTHIAPDVVAHSTRYTDGQYADAALIQPVVHALAKYGLIPSAIDAKRLISPYAIRK